MWSRGTLQLQMHDHLFFFSVKPFNENNIINQMLLMCKKISEDL